MAIRVAEIRTSARGMRRAFVAMAVLLLFATVSALPATGAPKPPSGGGGGGLAITDYSQCQNDGPPSTRLDCKQWGNGILNSSNSHYAEDEVTPQRLLLTKVPSGTHTIQLKYLTRKGTIHAYDSLATWNVTQTQADRCQGLQGCPAASTMSPPLNMLVDAASASHALPQASRQWNMFGGTLLSTTTAVIGADDYATVSVTFSTTTGTVQLLFGGHLAASTGVRGWGAGQGAANINGGPYHIKLDTIDGASAGDKDNQIQAGAILAGSPSFSVTKTANGQTGTITVAPGATVTYVITVTNNGTASGSTSFTDDFDDQLNPTTPVSNPSGGNCTREVSGNKLFNCSTSLLAAGGGQQSFTYSAVMPTTFGSGSSTTGCSTGQFAVRNAATLVTGGSSSTTVCVPGSPNITWTKKALNPVTGAEVTTVNPGATVLYRITATNSGSAPGSASFTDNYDDRLSPSAVTISHPPAGGTCSQGTVGAGDKVINCTTGVIDPGLTQTFSYTAVMPTTFDEGSSTDGCSPGQFAIKNTVTVSGTIVATKTVCVNASPGITFTKVALKPDGTPLGVVNPGDTVLYRITATNGGNAAGTASYIDNYDDRLTPSAVTVSHPPPGGSCSTGTINGGDKVLNCTTGTLNPGKSQTFSYTATMPTSFPSGSSTTGCAPGTFSVHNDVTVNGVIVASATVCVTAAPAFTSAKVALKPDGTALGTVNPGDTVLYKITVTNTGNAAGSTTFTDNYDDDITNISGVTSAPPGGSCVTATMADNTAGWSCTTGTIAPNGGTQTFTYTAKMPATFTGSPGGSGCSVNNPHQYPVHNDVILANGTTSSATVCVNASPNLHLLKSVTSDTDSFGVVHLTYTLSYSNTGPAEATTAGIVENVPTGTAFEGCDPPCNSSNLPQVSWTVGPIAPLTGTGSVKLTVTLTATTACQITNTATIQFDGDTPVSSNTVIVNVNPVANPAGAHANGDALGAQVLSSGILNINTAPISTASSSQSGLGGPQTDSDEILSIQIPSGGAVLDASVLRTTSASVVTASPAEARQSSTAEVAHVCAVKAVLGLCAVEADAVRAVASTTASGDSSSYSSAGSTITNLKVGGIVTPVDLNQTTTIPLSAALFGPGSYVAINERTGSTTAPAAGQSSGGTYSADLTVTMIHVKVTGLLGLQAAEVIIARATAHSDFPQTLVCPGAVGHSVSGHAYVAGLFVPGMSSPPLLANLLQGFVSIPATGGSESQHVVLLRVPADGSVVSAQAADASSTGSLSPNPNSVSIAEIAGDAQTPACVLRAGASCIATATLIHSESHSNAVAGNPGATSSDAGTQFVGLTVLGIPIAGTPAPNTTIPIPGLGFIVLNEQICDGGGLANHTCSGDNHSGLTVRAIHVYVNVQNLLGLDLGVELIVAEAHSDATFVG